MRQRICSPREALAILTSIGRSGRAVSKPIGKRRPKTPAEKAALSKAMRAAWRQRKAAAGAKRRKPAKNAS